MSKDLMWTGASTLGETVYRFIESGQGAGPEMVAMMKYFGTEKIESLYAAEKEKRVGEHLKAVNKIEPMPVYDRLGGIP